MGKQLLNPWSTSGGNMASIICTAKWHVQMDSRSMSRSWMELWQNGEQIASFAPNPGFQCQNEVDTRSNLDLFQRPAVASFHLHWTYTVPLFASRGSFQHISSCNKPVSEGEHWTTTDFSFRVNSAESEILRIPSSVSHISTRVALEWHQRGIHLQTSDSTRLLQVSWNACCFTGLLDLG